MARIKPFKRIKPKVDLVSEIAVLPVDSLEKNKINSIIENNPYSFFRITNPELYNDSVELSEPGKRFLNCCSRDCLDNLINENIFVEDSEQTFYIYKQLINDKSLTGLVACTSVDDYLNNVIKKHEHTRTEKEIDISYHINCCDANTGTIYLIYRWQEEIQNIIDECLKSNPEYNFTTEDGITHIIWPINCKEKVERLVHLFEKVNAFYIADGHHRSAAAARVCLNRRKENPNYTGEEEFNYFLSILFPDKDLDIIDYNRLVKDLNGLTKEEYMDKIKEFFEVEKYCCEKSFKPSTPHEFGMFIDGEWYKLVAKDGTFNENHPVESLDVCILQNNLLGPILGIDDPKTDQRIDFAAGVLGLEELEKRVKEDMAVAFSLYPCSVKELMDVSDCGEVMPPKSTWFEPKLRSGLFVHKLR